MKIDQFRESARPIHHYQNTRGSEPKPKPRSETDYVKKLKAQIETTGPNPDGYDH